MGKEIHLSGLESQRHLSSKLKIGVTGHRNELNDGTSGEDYKRPAPDITAIRTIIREVLILIYDAFKEIILNRIEKYDPKPVGNPQMDLNIISALASGADQWIADEAIKLGFKLEAVLPFNRDSYLSDFSNRMDAESYMYLIDHAAEIIEIDGKIWFDETGKRKHEGNTYEIAGNEILMRSDILIAVWDGNDSRGKGGTGQVVNDAKKKGLPVIWIPWSHPEKWRVGLPPYQGGSEPDELVGEKDSLKEIIRNLMQANETKYHKTLASYFQGKPLYMDGPYQKKPNIRKLVELPWQQTKGEMWDEVTETLCNLDFIQAKAAAKLTYELVNDFNTVLEVIPDNAKNILDEKERLARMDKYTLDLINCAKGEIPIDELEIPESITPWTNDQTDDETERIRNSPSNSDLLKDFNNFIGNEIRNLHNHATEINHFTHQQAWNYADSGSVGNAADNISSDTKKSLLLLIPAMRPIWNPMPNLIKVLGENSHNIRNYITAVSITPNGQFAVSYSNNSTLIVWDLKSGEPLNKIHDFGLTLSDGCLDITPDCKTAITDYSGNKISVWDLKSGKQLKLLPGHNEQITCLKISADGKFAISGSYDHAIILWNLVTGLAVHTLKVYSYEFPGHDNPIEDIGITTDLKYAISRSKRKIIMWDLKLGKQIKEFDEETKCMFIDPKGEYVFFDTNLKMIILDLRSGEVMETHKVETGCLANMNFSDDFKIAVLWNEKTLEISNLTSGEFIKKEINNKTEIKCIDITPDCKYAILGTYNNTLMLWNLESGHFSEMSKVTNPRVSCIKTSPSGLHALSGNLDNTLTLWDLRTGRHFKILRGHTKEVTCLSISSDGKFAISSASERNLQAKPLNSDCDLIIWDLNSGKHIKRLSGHTNYVCCAAISEDCKRVVTGARDKSIIVWNIESGKRLATFQAGEELIQYVAFKPRSNYILSGTDEHLIMWSSDSEEEIKKIKVSGGNTKLTKITPDGKYAISGLTENTLFLWDFNKTVPLKIFVGHYGRINCLAVTSDNRYAISGGCDNDLILWDLEFGHPRKTYRAEPSKVIKGHKGSIECLEITPGGGYVLSGSADKTMILYDIEQNKKISQFIGANAINSLAIFSSGIFINDSEGQAYILQTTFMKDINIV